MDMKIGVLSDSHASDLEDLPKKALDVLCGMDLIVHAGDYRGKRLLDGLRKLGNFKGVYGNMDPIEIRRELPNIEILEVGKFKIGIVHPSEGGSPFGLEKRIRKKFERVDVIIYGHTHRAKNKVVEGILYFNPGSVTGAFPSLYKSFGILTVNEEVKGKIVKI